MVHAIRNREGENDECEVCWFVSLVRTKRSIASVRPASTTTCSIYYASLSINRHAHATDQLFGYRIRNAAQRIYGEKKLTTRRQRKYYLVRRDGSKRNERAVLRACVRLSESLVEDRATQPNGKTRRLQPVFRVELSCSCFACASRTRE